MPRPRLFPVSVLVFACGCALLPPAGQAADAPAQPAFRVVHRGAIVLPHAAPDTRGNDVVITGLSGITWLGDDRYAAIMDNSDKLLLFSLRLAADGTPEEAADLKVLTLAEHHDYEDIAPCPEPLRERIATRRIRQGQSDPGRCLLVCEEDTPAIRAVSIDDGSLLGVIPIPPELASRRPNRGLEALDVEPDGHHIWTANEEALPADGPAATESAGTVVRLVRVRIPDPDQKSNENTKQFAYAADPPHQFLRVFSGEPLSGVAALAGLGDGRLLIMERAGCPGLAPFENRIYLVDTRDATDIGDVEKDLATRAESHIDKTLLWKDQLGINLEGLCLGPPLAGGGRSLLSIADNGGIGTPNQIVGFVLEDPSRDASLPLMIGGVAIAAAVVGLIIYRLAR
jgi:hypothetical protein